MRGGDKDTGRRRGNTAVGAAGEVGLFAVDVEHDAFDGDVAGEAVGT